MKAIYFSEHGDLSVLKYGDLPTPLVHQGETLIKVKAVSLNHLDIWVRRGWPGIRLPLPHVGGSDIVGEVVKSNGGSSFKPGDRIFVIPGKAFANDQWTEKGEESLSPSYKIVGEHFAGGMAEFVSVPTSLVRAAPAQISDASLAARLLVGVTCWRMLFTRGNLKKGESLLVVGSGGGVNSLTIQLAQALGTQLIVLAGTDEKCARVKKMGASHTINYKSSPNWAKEVISVTNGLGVDMVVDNVGANSYQQSLRALKRGGRLVTVGNTSGYEISIDNRFIFGKQLSIIGSTMGSINDLDSVLHFMDQHKIEPVIDCIDSLENGIKQLERLERGEQFGKIVLSV